MVSLSVTIFSSGCGDVGQSFPDLVIRSRMQLPQIGGSRIPAEWTEHGKIIGDIKPDEWDGFHDLIVQDELTRCGSAGWVY